MGGNVKDFYHQQKKAKQSKEKIYNTERCHPFIKQYKELYDLSEEAYLNKDERKSLEDVVYELLSLINSMAGTNVSEHFIRRSIKESKLSL